MTVTAGIHHVTAITADAGANLRFYRDFLGLRLVKVTVNFDDPTSHHLYYGNDQGAPGTVMTFFAWPGARRGRIGPPQVSSTAFAVAAGSLPGWIDRLRAAGVEHEEPATRFGAPVLRLRDPDGLSIELVESERAASAARVLGFASVTLSVETGDGTGELLEGLLGLRAEGTEGPRRRYRVPASESPGGVVDVLRQPGVPRGGPGSGVVHHVAFRVPGEVEQAEWRTRILAHGHNVSDVMDRVYFRSIYFREPGGVLFEIATDTPGFTVDEPIEELGRRLMLPPWLEGQRVAIERTLPPL